MALQFLKNLLLAKVKYCLTSYRSVSIVRLRMGTYLKNLDGRSLVRHKGYSHHHHKIMDAFEGLLTIFYFGTKFQKKYPQFFRSYHLAISVILLRDDVTTYFFLLIIVKCINFDAHVNLQVVPSRDLLL